MCQTGAGEQPWKSQSQEMDGNRAGLGWEHRWGSGPSPSSGDGLAEWAAAAQPSYSDSSPHRTCPWPPTTAPTPWAGICSQARKFWGAMQSFQQQLTNPELLQSCCGGNAARNLPSPCISIYKRFRLNSIFLPLALEQGKCILKGKFYRESKIKAIIMASSMCWGEARKPPELSQPSKGALQATTF